MGEVIYVKATNKAVPPTNYAVESGKEYYLITTDSVDTSGNSGASVSSGAEVLETLFHVQHLGNQFNFKMVKIKATSDTLVLRMPSNITAGWATWGVAIVEA